MAGGLLAWLRERLADPRIGYAVPPRRLPGGTDTRTYRFRLRGAPGGALAETLVLRLYLPAHGVDRALRESRIQQAVANAGFPAPAVHLVCQDPSVLGGAFFIMQFLPGESLQSAPPEAVPALLADAHLALHRLDPAPVVRALMDQGEDAAPRPPKRDHALIAAYANRFRSLAPVLDWMADNLPPAPSRPSLCHGDFHPLNLVVRNGEVTGVFDWPDFMVADPVADVASTLTLGILARHLYPESVRHRVWQRYLEHYTGESPAHPQALQYYCVRRCLIALLAGAAGRGLWRRPAVARDIMADIAARTGVSLVRPPWEGGPPLEDLK